MSLDCHNVIFVPLDIIHHLQDPQHVFLVQPVPMLKIMELHLVPFAHKGPFLI